MTYAPGTNTGHGWVWIRPDHMRARCGGPALCAQCDQDMTDKLNGATVSIAQADMVPESNVARWSANLKDPTTGAMAVPGKQ